MNQPKFKFLDKVRNKNNGEPFEIAKIVLEVDTYTYFSRNSYICSPESELELYTEPKEKKLYAYRDYRNSEKIYFLDTNYVHSSDRCPEYDINYSGKE